MTLKDLEDIFYKPPNMDEDKELEDKYNNNIRIYKKINSVNPK